MHRESLQDAPVSEIPDYDVRLESLESLLTTGHILARSRAANRGYLIVMALQEALSTGNDVSDYDCRAQRKEKVLVVRVKNEAFYDIALLLKLGYL